MRTRRKTHADAEILHRGLIVQSRTLALLGRRHVRVLGLLGVLKLLKLLEFFGVLEVLEVLGAGHAVRVRATATKEWRGDPTS